MNNTIGRKEIADLLGVNITWVSNIANHSNANMPEPVTDRRRNKPYCRDEIMAWLATNPKQNLSYSFCEDTRKSKVVFLQFLYGFDGANKRLNRYRKRRSMLYETKTLHPVPWSAESLNYF